MATVVYTRTAYDVDTIEYDGTNEAEIIALVGLGNVERRQSPSGGRMRLFVYGEAVDVGDLVGKGTTSKALEPKITPARRDTEYTPV